MEGLKNVPIEGFQSMEKMMEQYGTMPNMPSILPSAIWVCLKMLCTPKPNGFADHYPY